MYAFDASGWYTGTVLDGGVPDAPPISSTSAVPGELRARWVRYAWRVQAYEPEPTAPQPVAYSMDAAGWYAGEVAIGSPGSTTASPPISSTSSTPGDARARWFGGWVVRSYPEAVQHITRLAFLSRFTDAEAVSIDLASQGATPQAAAMRRYQAKVSAALFIDLARADTRAGVQALEAAGLLSAGRALEILDAPILETERPT